MGQLSTDELLDEPVVTTEMGGWRWMDRFAGEGKMPSFKGPRTSVWEQGAKNISVRIVRHMLSSQFSLKLVSLWQENDKILSLQTPLWRRSLYLYFNINLVSWYLFMILTKQLLSVGPTLRPCQIEQCKYLKEHQDSNAPLRLLSWRPSVNNLDDRRPCCQNFQSCLSNRRGPTTTPNETKV